MLRWLIAVLQEIERTHVYAPSEAVVIGYVDSTGMQKWLVTHDETIRAVMQHTHPYGWLGHVSDDALRRAFVRQVLAEQAMIRHVKANMEAQIGG